MSKNIMSVGQIVRFIVQLPIGKSGECQGTVSGILPSRGDWQGPSYMIKDVTEEGRPAGNYRIDTLPDDGEDEQTTILEIKDKH